MALPGHRRTSSDKRRRAAHFALKKIDLSVCSHCQKPVRPHHACASCGRYQGRETLDTKRQTARALKRAPEPSAAEKPAKAQAKKASKS